MDKLTITVNDDGTIKTTDYAQSGYNRYGLAYLHVHSGGLALLLPDASAAEWLREIRTGKQVVIEPPARSGYRKHIDLVFIDGTDSPFSLCLDKTAQVSAALRNRDTVMRVYDAAGSLKAELPCTVKLPMGDTYIAHVTTNTGHRHQSHRADVADNAMETVSGWLLDMLDGKTRAIFGDQYACRIIRQAGKSILFAISRVSKQMKHTDIVHFAVCRHSRDKALAWREVDGIGEAPQVPFCAVRLLDSVKMDDVPHLPLLADFERVLSWAWLEYQDNRPKNYHG